MVPTLPMGTTAQLGSGRRLKASKESARKWQVGKRGSSVSAEGAMGKRGGTPHAPNAVIRAANIAALVTVAVLVACVVGNASAQGNGATITIDSARLAAGESTRLRVEGVGFSDGALGALTLEVAFDADSVSVTGCEVDPGDRFDLALCGDEFVHSVVRMSFVAAAGEGGDFTLAEIAVTAGSQAGVHPIEVRIETLANAAGEEFVASTKNGVLEITGATDADQDLPDHATEPDGEAASDEPSDGAEEGEEASSEVLEAGTEGEEASSEVSDGGTEGEEASSEVSDAETEGEEASSEVSDAGTGDFSWWFVAVSVTIVALGAAGVFIMRRWRR